MTTARRCYFSKVRAAGDSGRATAVGVLTGGGANKGTHWTYSLVTTESTLSGGDGGERHRLERHERLSVFVDNCMQRQSVTAQMTLRHQECVKLRCSLRLELTKGPRVGTLRSGTSPCERGNRN